MTKSRGFKSGLCGFLGLLREIVRSSRFGKEYLHYYRNSDENGILKAHMGVMEIICCSI
jgi:hypothetical protein